MERANSGGDGGIRLPIGFRFRPTDEELLLHYLKRKIFSLPLPATVIPELEVSQSNPWDLPGELKEKRYFFCQRRSNCVSKCSSSSIRLSGDCGYWKSTGKDKKIMAPGSNLLIGIKRSFVFYKGKSKTQWIMHELCLVGSINSSPYNIAQKLMVQVGDWVVCRVYQRKKKARSVGTVAQIAANNSMKFSRSCLQGGVIMPGDHKNEQLGFSFSAQTSSSYSSCSSGITDIAASSELDQEANSHNVNF